VNHVIIAEEDNSVAFLGFHHYKNSTILKGNGFILHYLYTNMQKHTTASLSEKKELAKQRVVYFTIRSVIVSSIMLWIP
jgi:hypothetical protein